MVYVPVSRVNDVGLVDFQEVLPVSLNGILFSIQLYVLSERDFGSSVGEDKKLGLGTVFDLVPFCRGRG